MAVYIIKPVSYLRENRFIKFLTKLVKKACHENRRSDSDTFYVRAKSNFLPLNLHICWPIWVKRSEERLRTMLLNDWVL